jgi:hypothetical protein
VKAFLTQCPAIFPEPPAGGERCLPHLHLGVSRRGPDCESCALPGTTPPPQSPSISLHRFRESTCDHWHSFGGWEILAEATPALVPRAKRWGGRWGVREGGSLRRGRSLGAGRDGPACKILYMHCCRYTGMNFLYMFG